MALERFLLQAEERHRDSFTFSMCMVLNDIKSR